MTGLFSRLAQQNLGQQSENLKIARSPVFTADPDPASSAFGSDENREDENQEGSDHRFNIKGSDHAPHTRGSAPVLSDPDKQDAETNSLVSKSTPGSKVDVSPRQILSEPLHSQPPTEERDNPVSSQSITENNADNFSRAESLTENRQAARSILPANRSEHEDRLSNRSRSDLADSQDPSLLENRKVLHRPSSPVPAKHTASVGMRSSAESETSRFSKKMERKEANTTTVNVTIGRVEVLAIQDSNPPSETKPQSRRKPVLLLDEYQRKRQRGER